MFDYIEIFFYLQIVNVYRGNYETVTKIYYKTTFIVFLARRSSLERNIGETFVLLDSFL